ncbi:hypothetical protein HBI26_135220 [Parastagonospora nodorum]|nr:hypothetical protein HBI26_135220 [Parastagonospora nodorum]
MATDENVDTLLSFIDGQLSRDEALQLLKISDNNLEAAVNKFFETGPANINKLLKDAVPRWDETAFGGGQNDGVPTSFNIDYGPHSNVQSRAPTRPPSRTSQVSTHLGDAPMQSIENTQESGVVGGSKPAFGPANQDYYPAETWAMVPTSTEVIPDPSPSQRKREEGHPAILKPSPRFNYLPALISILHSIPLFRNALLAPNITQRNYWMGDDWWKGSPALPARVTDTAAEREEAHSLDIIYEAQRLMAFLDNSDRAYATVSSMLELDAWKESRPTMEDEDDDLIKFLILWSAAYEAQVPAAQLNGLIRSIVKIGNDTVENFVLDASVVREGTKKDYSIYDVLDEHLFSSATGSAHLSEPSKVLILRLTSATTNAQGLGCRIPATLYPDRYLEANKPVIDAMFGDMKKYEDDVKEVEATIQRLKYHTPKKEKAKKVGTLKLLETSMKAFKPQTENETPDPKDAMVLSQLEALHQSIEAKLAALEEQTKQVRETLHSISSRFKPIVDDGAEVLIDLTEPSYPPGQSPQDAMQHPYHLCGVATHFGVIYLLHPDNQSPTPGAQQWWRIQYDTETSSPSLRRDRLTQQEVVERAATESSAALLIYAHASALSVAPIPLSKPLEDFVKKDALNFHEELQTDWQEMDTAAIGDWDKDPPDYEYDWNSMSAQQWHTSARARGDSSATLTPNTEHDGAAGVREMVEVNGGMDAMMGVESSRSSSTIEGDAMEVEHGTAVVADEGAGREGDEVRVQHIEVAEKKGG